MKHSFFSLLPSRFWTSRGSSVIRRRRSLTFALAVLLLTTAGVAVAQPNCLISAEHGTYDRSTTSLGNNVLTVDEGGNWFLTLTFKCTGITDPATHNPEIIISGLTPGGNLWTDDTNARFTGGVWNMDGLGPTSFKGSDPEGDFTARVRVWGTSVDNNCHDSGASTQMQFSAAINNSVDSSSMATRDFTVTAKDDDPLSVTFSPGEPWEVTIDNWKQPCS